jgi:hypothetical protein
VIEYPARSETPRSFTLTYQRRPHEKRNST